MPIQFHDLPMPDATTAAGAEPAEESRLTAPPFEPVTTAPEPQPEAAAGREAATLQFVGGVSNLTLRVDPGLTARYAARFQGPQPEVIEFGDEITIRYPWGPFAWGRTAADVRLRPDVVWTLRLRGGLSHGEIDLRGTEVAAFDVTGGVSRMELALGDAHGTVPVRIRGGVSRLEISRPSTFPARIDVNGGASRLSLDDQILGAVGGHIRLESTGFPAAGDRFEIEVGGGASRLSVRPR